MLWNMSGKAGGVGFGRVSGSFGKLRECLRMLREGFGHASGSFGDASGMSANVLGMLRACFGETSGMLWYMSANACGICFGHVFGRFGELRVCLRWLRDALGLVSYTCL